MYVKQSDFDRGRLALDRFRKLIATRYRPLLRAVTGNDKLNVEVHSSQALTDNKTVWLPVPLALGDETLEHDKSLCGRREAATLVMLCAMCKVEDETDALVLHESAHITEKSFQEIDGHTFLKNVRPVIEPYLAQLDDDKLRRFERDVKSQTSAMGAANKVDPWLPLATNVIEDVYVNRRLVKYRLGAELPLMLHTRDVFVNGIQDLNSGSLHQWKDNDRNAQALISAYLIGQGLPELGKYLAPEHDLTNDPKLHELVGKIPGDCDVSERIKIAVELVMHLRTLGYCPAKEETILPPIPPTPPPKGESEPQPPEGGQGEPQPGQGGEEGESDDEDDEESGSGSEESEDESEEDGQAGDGQSDSSEGEDGDDDEEADGQGGDTEDEDEPYDGGDQTSPEDSESEDEEDSSESSGPSDEEVDEALERAKKMLTEVMGHDEDGPNDINDPKSEQVIDQVLRQENMDHPSHEVEEARIVTRKDAPYDSEPYYSLHESKVARNILTPSISRLRVVFSSNKKTGLERNLKAGTRLDTMHLYRAGTDDPRIFGQRHIPKARDWFVVVGLDFSGSTISNGAREGHKMAGHAIGELLHLLDIKFEMYAHTSMDVDYGSGLALEHVLIKGVNENWRDKKVQQILFSQTARGYNLDGHSMEQYRKVMEASRATDKLLMYFTDGKMPMQNYNEELELLTENIEKLRKMRTHLVGIGWQTDSPRRHGLDTICINSAEDIPTIVKGLEDRLLR